ncbi:MAG: TetR/AcrR family transcriptional regulator [Bacteroidetes bacterium]|nr:MAG: TetR/AcrR family transcriptional regulator [Bacteroidota bacterium]
MKRLKTELRQEQIIDEAISLIHSNGFSALSIRELGNQVGISEAAIYRHFKSKDEIIKGIIIRIHRLSEDLFISLDNIKQADKKLKHFILYNMNLFTQFPALVSIFMAEEIFEHNTTVSNDLKLIIKKRHSTLLNIIDEGIMQGIFIDVESETVAAMIQGYIRLTLLRWKRSNNNFSLIGTGEKFFKILQILLNKNKKHN